MFETKAFTTIKSCLSRSKCFAGVFWATLRKSLNNPALFAATSFPSRPVISMFLSFILSAALIISAPVLTTAAKMPSVFLKIFFAKSSQAFENLFVSACRFVMDFVYPFTNSLKSTSENSCICWEVSFPCSIIFLSSLVVTPIVPSAFLMDFAIIATAAGICSPNCPCSSSDIILPLEIICWIAVNIPCKSSSERFKAFPVFT